LTWSLAAELGPLRINAIPPGYIDSSMSDGRSPLPLADARSRVLAATPLRRFGSVQDVADSALFLVLNEYANNCVLNRDGG
jgi:NAD(P)-dependent dehydrogenase (short-subunit alcohol dehydrogenase family)